MECMRTVGSLLAAVLLVGPASDQQPKVDALTYLYTLSIPDTGSMITGLAWVTVRMTGASDSIRLDLVGMQVDSVWRTDGYDARSSLDFRYDGRALRTVVSRNAVGNAGIQIKYHGIPQDGLIIGSTARGRRAAFADNWPERARYWLPTFDHPRDKASVMFMVEAPDGWRVVSNGKPQPCSRREPERRVLCRWAESRAIPTYTMVIGAGEFTVSKHRPVINGRDTIPIEVWTYPEDSAFADSVPFRRATEIVETMQRLIGPFPYEKLAHVQSSTKFGGMENSSAIFYAEKPYVERRMGEGVVRHETAHQWFGDAVTERDWPDVWLSEGFATYFDGVIGAALDGDSVLVNRMRSNADDYFKSDVTDRPIVDSAYAADPIKLLNANSYPKGAWVLHMLRGLMGDSAFFRGLRTYYRTYRDSNATSADFQRVMEKAARKDLGWFFHQWLHQPGYPQLDVTWQYDTGARRAVVGITQRQKPEWGLFRLPALTLEFRGADGATMRRDVALRGDSRETTTRVNLPFAPTEVRVDPDGKLLLRVTAVGRT
jgi:aminopeptidase N